MKTRPMTEADAVKFFEENENILKESYFVGLAILNLKSDQMEQESISAIGNSLSRLLEC